MAEEVTANESKRPPLDERTRRAVDDLCRWIGYASVSSTSNDAVNESIADRLRGIGFDVDVQRFRDASGVPKSNVVAVRDGGDGPGSAYFAHSDVVPADEWTGPGGDPFTGVIHERRVYGRGACDMKGSLAAMVAAAGDVPPERQSGPVSIVVTADEEVGFLGARTVRDHPVYRDAVRRQPIAVIGEPTSMRPVHGHKGVTVAWVTSRGEAAHSATGGGVNATDAMVPMLTRLSDWSRRLRSDPAFHHADFDPVHGSLNYGVAAVPGAINVVPAVCRAWVMLRTMPGVDDSPMWDDLRRCADENDLQFRETHRGEPVLVSQDSDHVRTVERLTGHPSTTVSYGTDGGEYDELHRRIVLGPGDIAQAHTADEFITIEQLRRGVDVFATLIENGE